MSIRLGLRVKGTISKALETTTDWETIEKAVKYIRRWRGKNGKWNYLYPKDMASPFSALKRLFNLADKSVADNYEKQHIKKEYGTDKKTFAAHELEYLSNRLKWDNIFGKKENREKYGKPVKQKDMAAAVAVEKLNDDDWQPGFFEEPKIPKTNIINRSLMYKIWEIYNPHKKLDGAAESADNGSGGINDGKDNIGTGSKELSEGTGEIRPGGGEEPGDQHVPGAWDTPDQSESGIGTAESGKRPLGQRGRSSIKAIREQVKKLLAEKSDSEMTEEDKVLLRQYEGAGGLAEADASAHGTLYEFYTPEKVVDKVWSLVDKYNPRTDKTVIEPSAGTGRFAEGRQEKFSLFELDETSARIAGILHPDAKVKQGYFQELFMSGRTPKKSYDGPKYDVAIGNPPYGEYSGLHRGMGEGKEHTRIEEYFIDRSLDTLKDGGILAMVVPSSFLRGKSSKAKEKIAGKAQILEAWRLPNGTFGTTGVGTDIIVLRKESGDVADYQNDLYFQNNLDHIAGDETERQGKFGMEKYVAPPLGMSFDEALGMIDPEKVPNVPTGEKSPEQEAIENIESKETDVEAHANRSEAMMGNQNAKKLGALEEKLKELEAANEKSRGWLKTGERKLGGGTLKLTGRQKAEIKGNIKLTESQIYDVQQEISKLTAAEAHENRSQAMMGNQNAYKGARAFIEEESGTWLDGLPEPALDSILQDRTNDWFNAKTEDEKEKLQAAIDAVKERLSRIGSKVKIDKIGIAGNQGAIEQPSRKRRKRKEDEFVPSIGKNMSADEFNKKYGKNVNPKDFPIWKVTDYDGKVDVSRLSEAEKNWMKESGNFTTDADGNWYNIANYASGNIHVKLEELESQRKTLGERTYQINKSILEAVKPHPKTADHFSISPISDFAKEYEIKDDEGHEYNLRDAFFQWIGLRTYGYGRRARQDVDMDESPISQYEIPPHITIHDVIAYIRQDPVRTDKATAKETDAATARMEAETKRIERRECAERLFNRFIREGLPGEYRKKLGTVK
jgi:hypothetical protein